MPSQYRDTDGDGYGDNLEGYEGDVCPHSTVEEVESGWISWSDRFGCLDSDMDGFSNPDDWWISHPDGFADAFPEDETQWYDTDDDGYGDNLEYFDGELGGLHGEEMAVLLQKATLPWIDGVVLILMEMVGQTLLLTG